MPMIVALLLVLLFPLSSYGSDWGRNFMGRWDQNHWEIRPDYTRWDTAAVYYDLSLGDGTDALGNLDLDVEVATVVFGILPVWATAGWSPQQTLIQTQNVTGHLTHSVAADAAPVMACLDGTGGVSHWSQNTVMNVVVDYLDTGNGFALLMDGDNAEQHTFGLSPGNDALPSGVTHVLQTYGFMHYKFNFTSKDRSIIHDGGVTTVTDNVPDMDVTGNFQPLEVYGSLSTDSAIGIYGPYLHLCETLPDEDICGWARYSAHGRNYDDSGFACSL